MQWSVVELGMDTVSPVITSQHILDVVLDNTKIYTSNWGQGGGARMSEARIPAENTLRRAIYYQLSFLMKASFHASPQ